MNEIPPRKIYPKALHKEVVKEISCGIITVRFEKKTPLFLLLHYIGGHIDFPKGHTEKGESYEETAIRELIEETGISDVRILPGFRQNMSYYYKFRQQDFFKTVYFFIGITAQKQVQISREHTGHYWLKYQDALKKVTFQNAKELLKKAHKFLQKTRPEIF